MHFIAIAATALLLLFTTWLVLVMLMVRARLHPPRLSALRALFTLGRAHPDDLGYAFTPLTFDITYIGRPLRLSASLVNHPQAAGHLVIVLHGFADSGAGALAWLPALHRCGVNVLFLDLPGHGESGDAICSAGWFERHAVAQVISQIQERHPADSRRITLFGISMGASTAMATALADSRVAAVIADSPYADFPSACRLHARLFGLPGQLFQRPATWIIERYYGIKFAELAPTHIVPKLPCPLLLLQAEHDQLISPGEMEEMRESIRDKQDGKSRELTIAGASHILSLAKAPQQYEEALSQFLQMTRDDRL